MDGVMEKLRSILRFLGLAAFILGPLWYLYTMTMRGLWISGMIGLTLALVGYIILRLVDEEKGWRGAVLRAARLALGKIRTWPFWIQGGLLSLVLAATMFFNGLFGGHYIIHWLALLLMVITVPTLVPAYNTRFPIDLEDHYVFLIGYWFLLGSLLGKVTESSSRRYRAFVILWSVILATLAVAMTIFFNYIFGEQY
jgi:hypothetical protein